ncbi:MAG: type VI secretion system Vgr family protein [Paracraurococcus sp.]
MSGAQRWSLSVVTAAGPDAFALESVEGEEHLSAPFRFTLRMSALQEVDPTAIIGKPAHIVLQGAEGRARHLHGLVTRLAGAGTSWTAELRPWLWRLSLSADSRIFQGRTVPQILDAIFDDLKQVDHRAQLTAIYQPLDYCVQYQETAFAFVSRLMEAAGIAYHFEHTAEAHTLVLTDDPSAFKPCTGDGTLPFHPGDVADWRLDDRITAATLEHALVADGYVANDFNFTTPANSLKATGGSGTWQLYEYPAGYDKLDAGNAVAKRRQELIEAEAVILSGQSPVRDLRPGATFTLKGHPTAALNVTWAVRSVRHSAGRREYGNDFTAMPATAPFRPARTTPVPRIAGAQTAIVVGASGKETWTDKYGRVKVQFHWDRYGKKDETSSCWVRVAQGWSGVNWGAFALPRVGQEVVVTFLEGDPDRPLITGCVYNGDNPVPYTLPDNQTRTTFKTNSSPGGGGFNEIRFEDAKDKEELYLHAQKDLKAEVLNDRTQDIGHDDVLTVKNDRKVTVTEGAESLTVSQGDRTVTVATGKETHSVKGTRSLTVTGAETRKNEADFTHTVSGNLTISVDGNVTIKAGGSLTLQSGTALTVKAGTGLTASAGTALSLSGGTTAEVKGSASGTLDGGGMLTIKGGLVKIN